MAWVITYPTDTTWQAVNTLPDGVFDLTVSADTGETAGLTVSVGDTTAPTVTSFTLPATSSSLTVPITTLTATDNTAVTGYLVTESAAPPDAGDTGWKATAAEWLASGYAFASAGSKTLYAWAKDAAGNVSAGVSASVVISLAVAGSATIIGVSATTSVATIISSVAAVPGVSQFKAPDGTPITFLTIYGEPITFNF